MIHIGENLKTIRTILGVKQATLAYELGQGQQFVTKLENMPILGLDLLVKISVVLGVSVEVIIGFSREKALENINKLGSAMVDSDETNVNINLFDYKSKIIELYERLLLYEQDKRTKLDCSPSNSTREEFLHQGERIRQVRLLRGLSQSRLGENLGGITKQAISKMEQSNSIEDERLTEIAQALDVTVDGLKNFGKSTILLTTSSYPVGGKTTNFKNFNQYSIKNVIEHYEKLLKG